MRARLAAALLASAALALAACPDDEPDPPCGAGQEVEVLQLAAEGLSAVESLPDTPERLTLDPNAALIDGDLAASALVDLGTAAADPSARRDLGVRFADLPTVVRIDVHVEPGRALTPELAALFTWAAYRSEDNAVWTAVASSGPAAWNGALSRFEVPIERTQAPYLKVVTTPLAPGATQDPQYAELLVTELRLVEIVPVFCPQ